MAFTDEELKFTLQKAQEIQKWTDLVQRSQDLPSGYDTLTYRLSIRGKLNLNIILDRLRLDRKDGLAQQVETAKDNLFNEVKAYDKNYDKNNQLHLPDFSLCDTADRLVILIRKIFNDETEDRKKLSMYADNIEDLVSDDLTLYPAIWKKQFEILLNIAVGYNLFNALLDRIEEKNKTAGAQLKAKYQQLKEISDVDNAKEKELKAVESAALDLVSLMRKIANKELVKADFPPGTIIGQKSPNETRQEVNKDGASDEKKLTWQANAIGLAFDHRDWSVQKIADTVGRTRQALYNDKDVGDALKARNQQKRPDKSHLPKGEKDSKTGNLEAWK